MNFFDNTWRQDTALFKSISATLESRCDDITFIIYINKNIDLNNFEQIEFIHEELSYKFILDKNDLFVDYKDKKYFLCIFIDEDLDHSSKNWIFGTPFIKKYNFAFDQDSKIILFYEQIGNKNENIEINANNDEIRSISIGITIKH